MIANRRRKAIHLAVNRLFGYATCCRWSLGDSAGRAAEVRAVKPGPGIYFSNPQAGASAGQHFSDIALRRSAK